LATFDFVILYVLYSLLVCQSVKLSIPSVVHNLAVETDIFIVWNPNNYLSCTSSFKSKLHSYKNAGILCQ